MPIIQKAYVLSDDELTLVREIEQGISGGGRGRWLQISAGVLQAIILRLPVAFPRLPTGTSWESREVISSGTGIEIIFCVIRGVLDLENACLSNGDSLPALTLDTCIFYDTIKLSNARFRKLSLANSRITEVLAYNMRVDGTLWLYGMKSSETDKDAAAYRIGPEKLTGYGERGKPIGLARIDLKGSHIGHELNCNDSYLATDLKMNTSTDPSERYALDLSMCVVQQGVFATNGEFSGGIDARDIKVLGCFTLDGSRLSRPEATCLVLWNSDIRTGLYLNASSNSRPFVAQGTLNLNDSLLGGLWLQGAHLSNPVKNCGHVLHADNVTVRRSLDMRPAHGLSTILRGKFDIRRTKIDGDARLDGFRFEHISNYKKTPLFRVFGFPPDEIERRDVVDLIDATGTTVAGGLLVSLDVQPVDQQSKAGDPVIYPRVILSGVTVGAVQDLNAEGWGKGVVLVLNQFRSIAPNVRSNKLFNVVSISKVIYEKKGAFAVLSLLLFSYALPLTSVVCAFLRCYQTALLLILLYPVFLTFQAWMTFAAAPDLVKGKFRTAMSAVFVSPFNLILERGDAIHFYRPFLDRQFYDRDKPYFDEYNPSVYEDLAKQLREDGHDAESRGILNEKYRVRRQVEAVWYVKPSWLIFDTFFGHGFSPKRAIVTFFVCLVVGTAGVNYSNDSRWLRPHQSVLVVSTTTVNTMAFYNQDEATKTLANQPYAITLQKTVDAKAQPTGEILCGKRIDPRLYALELFVPALDLHQTSQCEISSEDSARGWRIARAGYTILGWIVTSITLLTIPGILRRQAEG